MDQEEHDVEIAKLTEALETAKLHAQRAAESFARARDIRSEAQNKMLVAQLALNAALQRALADAVKESD